MLLFCGVDAHIFIVIVKVIPWCGRAFRDLWSVVQSQLQYSWLYTWPGEDQAQGKPLTFLTQSAHPSLRTGAGVGLQTHPSVLTLEPAQRWNKQRDTRHSVRPFFWEGGGGVGNLNYIPKLEFGVKVLRVCYLKTDLLISPFTEFPQPPIWMAVREGFINHFHFEGNFHLFCTHTTLDWTNSEHGHTVYTQETSKFQTLTKRLMFL